MALVVETGAGVANADTWASLAYAKQYATRVGNTAFVDADTEFLEPALRKAVRYLDAVYGDRYAGVRTNPRSEQSLSWPRAGFVWDDGEELADNVIPQNLIDAQVEAAMLEWASPGALQPSAGAPRGKKAVQVGPISVTYDDAASSASSPGKAPLFSTIDGLMVPLLDVNKASNVQFLLRA